jgi:hypothetical protein
MSLIAPKIPVVTSVTFYLQVTFRTQLVRVFTCMVDLNTTFHIPVYINYL